MRGAELLRHFALVLERVNGDQVGRPRETGALHRVDADTADAVYDHGLTWLDLGGVDRRSPAGRYAAADEHRLVQREVVVDLHHGALVNGGVLAERADHAHRAEVLTLAVEHEAPAR